MTTKAKKIITTTEKPKKATTAKKRVGTAVNPRPRGKKEKNAAPSYLQGVSTWYASQVAQVKQQLAATLAELVQVRQEISDTKARIENLG